MKIEFNARRFGLLLKRDAFSVYRTAAVAALAVSLVVILVSLISAWSGDIDPAFHQNFFLAILLLGGLIVTSRVFIDMHSSKTIHDWMMLPASLLEKHLSRLLASTIIWILGALVGYSIISLASEGLNRLIFGRGHLLLNPFVVEIWKAIPYYLVTQSIFFLGAVYFRKNHLIKTVLILALFALVLALVTALLGRVVFWDYFSAFFIPTKSLDLSCSIEPAQEAQFESFLQVMSVIGKILYWGVLAPACWFLSYLRIREQEVRNAV
jgi:hypothetical protein